MFPVKLLPNPVKHPPNNINSKIIKYDEPQFNNPDPHAINKNIIGATAEHPLLPNNPLLPPLLLLFVQQHEFWQQHGEQQHSWQQQSSCFLSQQHFFSQQHLFFFLDIITSPS